jgi:hypothetical protein
VPFKKLQGFSKLMGQALARGVLPRLLHGTNGLVGWSASGRIAGKAAVGQRYDSACGVRTMTVADVLLRLRPEAAAPVRLPSAGTMITPPNEALKRSRVVPGYSGPLSAHRRDFECSEAGPGKDSEVMS